jgi:hypothetical protein
MLDKSKLGWGIIREESEGIWTKVNELPKLNKGIKVKVVSKLADAKRLKNTTGRN